MVVFCGFNTDQKDLVAEKLTGMRACNKFIDDHGSLSETVTHILPLGGGHEAAEALHLERPEAEGQVPVVRPPGAPGPGPLLLPLPVHPHGPVQPELGHILLVAVALGVLHAVQGLVLLEVCSGLFSAL